MYTHTGDIAIECTFVGYCLSVHTYRRYCHRVRAHLGGSALVYTHTGDIAIEYTFVGYCLSVHTYRGYCHRVHIWGVLP